MAYPTGLPTSPAAPGLGASAASGQLYGLGNQLANYGTTTQNYGLQALKDAFDPMGSQRASGLATTMDSTNAALANSGLMGTPYAAGVSGGAAGNFANNWQTAQIGREATGMGTATAATQPTVQAGQLINSAGQLDMAAAANMLSMYGLQGQQYDAALRYLAAMAGVSKQGSMLDMGALTNQRLVSQAGATTKT